jgi:hypothetical protein
MSAQDIELEFPKLRAEGYTITSADTTDYNCFAWVVHDTDHWYSPLPINGYYWPENIPRNTGLQTFIQLYNREGDFIPCKDGSLERGFEKIALYMNAAGGITHAARQQPTGVWTSKLGVKEDIEHVRLTGLEDDGVKVDDYGKVVQFLKRPAPNNG